MRALAAAMISLILIFGLAAQDVFAQSGRDAREEVRRGGWTVAFGNRITEREAYRGEVEPGLSVFNSNRRDIRDWADRMLDRTMNEFDSKFGSRDNFLRQDRSSQRDVRKFLVNTVRDSLQSGRERSDVMTIGRLEVKAGVIKYYSRRSDSKVFVPYLGLRVERDRGYDSRRRY